MTIPNVTSVENPSRPTPLVTAGLAACLVVLFGAAYSYGLAARAASEQSEAARIWQENRAFCASLGLTDKTEPYTRCTSGLTGIRQRERERFEAESAGIL
jgi:hypothetical protein